MSNYIKLAEAPAFVYQSPQCGNCSVDLEHDGEGWQCPICGTAWDSDAGDGDTGELYESWSGETLAAFLEGERPMSGSSFHLSKRQLDSVFGPLDYKRRDTAHPIGGYLYTHPHRSILFVFTWSNFKHSPESQLVIREVTRLPDITHAGQGVPSHNLASVKFTKATWHKLGSEVAVALGLTAGQEGESV